MLRHNCPGELKIDPEVLVYDDVSEPDNLSPGDFRVNFAQFRGYASARFAKQRQTVQNRALNE